MADIKDVAKLAGVSISTVSNVMTGKKTVSPALEERVLKAVKELGYHASPIAQGMRNSRTNTIGVVISSFQRVFFGPMLKGIQDTVSEAGCVMNVLDSGGSLETEKRCVKYLVATKADGIIMESLAYDSDPKQEKYVKGLNALGNSRKHIPVVLLEHKISAARVDTVMVDNRLSARKAVEHLIGCGRREIAHIVGPDYVSVSRMRLLGYMLNDKMVTDYEFGVAYVSLTEEEMRRFDFIQGDSEGFVNYPLSIRGIRMSAMFIQTKHSIRVSLRSRGEVDVNVFARRYFDGGGHRNAAGGKSYVPMNETLENFRKYLREYFGA